MHSPLQSSSMVRIIRYNSFQVFSQPTHNDEYKFQSIVHLKVFGSLNDKQLPSFNFSEPFVTRLPCAVLAHWHGKADSETRTSRYWLQLRAPGLQIMHCCPTDTKTRVQPSSTMQFSRERPLINRPPFRSGSGSGREDPLRL